MTVLPEVDLTRSPRFTVFTISNYSFSNNRWPCWAPSPGRRRIWKAKQKGKSVFIVLLIFLSCCLDNHSRLDNPNCFYLLYTSRHLSLPSGSGGNGQEELAIPDACEGGVSEAAGACRHQWPWLEGPHNVGDEEKGGWERKARRSRWWVEKACWTGITERQMTCLELKITSTILRLWIICIFNMLFVHLFTLRLYLSKRFW